MKILFITGSLNQGGAEFQLLQLAKLFKNYGHTIEVFAITDYDFYKPFIEVYKIKYNHLYNHQSRLKRIFLTGKKIKEEKPDLIISYLKQTSQVALVARWLSGSKVKLIVGERTSDIQPLHDKVHFNLMRFADFVTVNSISKLEYLKERFPFLRNKIDFFPNIIDIEKFKLVSKKQPIKNLKIGFVGRISPEKNIINLVKAIQILKGKNKPVALHIYGDARNQNYLNDIKDLIGDNQLESKIYFMGRTNNVLEVYKSIDLLCLISDYEGFSNVISEALSCGIPVITSNIPENKYLIEDAINGFVVDEKDPYSIAQGIVNFIELPNKSKLKMSKLNRIKAEMLFDADSIYNKYLELIKKL